MSKDKFTNELPTEEGYYWHRRFTPGKGGVRFYKKATPCAIIRYLLDDSDDLKLSFAGVPFIYELKDFPNEQWLGPIVIPES